MALFGVFIGAGWLPVTFYTVLLMFNVTCQYFFLWFANISTIEWTIAVMSNMHKRKVRETLEISRLKILNETDKTFKVLNRDNDDYVTTNGWKPLFRKIGNHETVILTLDFALVWKRLSLSEGEISLPVNNSLYVVHRRLEQPFKYLLFILRRCHLEITLQLLTAKRFI